MRPQLFMTAVGIFIIATLLACLASGRWLLNGEMNIFNALASFNAAEIQSGGGVDIAKGMGGVGGFLDAVVTMFSWDYPFLESPWAILVKIPLWLVSIGVIWAIIEVGSNAIQGIFAALRNLTG